MKHRLPQIREMALTVGRNVKTAFRFSFVLPSDYAMGKPLEPIFQFSSII
jgi:hypothetical protein